MDSAVPSVFRNGKFNAERTLPGVRSYLEELILHVSGCVSERGNIEFTLWESTGWLQHLHGEEPLRCWGQ